MRTPTVRKTPTVGIIETVGERPAAWLAGAIDPRRFIVLNAGLNIAEFCVVDPDPRECR
jgi:hypothetical protein